MLSRTTTVWPASTSSPTRDADGDDDGRRRRAHDALLVAGDPVGDAVDLDQVRRGGVRRHDGEALAADGEPALQRAEPVDVDVDVPPVELHPVAARADLGDGQPVGLPAVAELDDAPDVVRGAGPPAAGRGEERRPLQRLLGVGDVDRHLDERDGGVAARGRRRRRSPVRSSQAVSAVPATTSGRSSRSSRNDLVVVPPRSTTVVSRSAHAQPGERLRPVAAPGDDLGDHRVVGRAG